MNYVYASTPDEIPKILEMIANTALHRPDMKLGELLKITHANNSLYVGVSVEAYEQAMFHIGMTTTHELLEKISNGATPIINPGKL